MDLGETFLTMVGSKLRKPHDIDNMNVHPCKNELIRNESVSAILIKLLLSKYEHFCKSIPKKPGENIFCNETKTESEKYVAKICKTTISDKLYLI